MTAAIDFEFDDDAEVGDDEEEKVKSTGKQR